MIIYGNDQNYYNNTFIVKKLNKLNIYWNYKIFTDHLSLMESLKMLKSLIKDKVIFLSLEVVFIAISTGDPMVYLILIYLIKC